MDNSIVTRSRELCWLSTYFAVDLAARARRERTAASAGLATMAREAAIWHVDVYKALLQVQEVVL